MAESEFLEVYRSFDSIEASMLAELLQKEGFTARHLGTRNAASIGAGQLVCEQRIEVLYSQANEAKAFIEAFTSPLSQTDAEEEQNASE